MQMPVAPMRVEQGAVVVSAVFALAAVVNRLIGGGLAVQSTNLLLVAILAMLVAIWVRAGGLSGR